MNPTERDRLMETLARLTGLLGSAGDLPVLAELADACIRRFGGAASALGALSGDVSREATLVPGGGGAHSGSRPAGPAGERYLVGREIGRGGIGRVVEAEDREVGRTVALKLLMPGAGTEAEERFRWEGQVTGRLEHPNIVPVHGVGMLADGGEMYVCMKRILGRDMHRVIRSGEWPLRKLVEAFRDVCRALAYAHARGVVHRDLKPSNVMLGEFGETLVVDWGLAKATGEPDRHEGARGGPVARGAGESRTAGESGILRSAGLEGTMDGSVLGTPAYMPPEQARGAIGEIDARSDVYSLGAILYEILTGVPPYSGESQWEIVRAVLEEPLTPPSARSPAVPADLEGICLRAMARDRAARPADAGVLAREVEGWLEGTRERERRATQAAELIERAEAELERWKTLDAQATAAAAEARLAYDAVPQHAPLEAKRPAWEMEDGANARMSESLESFAVATGLLASALENVPGHPRARRLLAEAWWRRFEEADRARDLRSAEVNLRFAKHFNDGVLDARVLGEGSLAVRSVGWRCACLREGRRVEPAELAVVGYHPWSGRRLSGPPIAAFPEFEPAEAVRLRVHAADCPEVEVEGARVWAWRYAPSDRRLVPVTPACAAGSGPPAPDALLDAVFGDSPARPSGPGWFLGTTPIAPRPCPMGSWLLVLEAPGFAPARAAAFIARQESAAVTAPLFAPRELPAGFLTVPRGRFFYQGDPENPFNAVGETPILDDVALARFPVTCADYAEFLQDLSALNPAEAARRVPQDSGGVPYWPPAPGGGWEIPTPEWLASAPPEARASARRLQSATADWERRWPVFSIAFEDTLAWLRWKSLREGYLFTLPTEYQWEKGARGVDGRPYPWGDRFESNWCNSQRSREGAMHPVPVDDYPTDESPWGLRGMGSGVKHYCLDDTGMSDRIYRTLRGGAWSASGRIGARSAYRAAVPVGNRFFTNGFRAAAAIRLGGAPNGRV